MAKYDPLRDALRRAGSSVELSFAEIAELVGGLPPSAYEHRAWWSNGLSLVQGQAWRAAGMQVDHVNLTARRVRFVRTGQGHGAADHGEGNSIAPRGDPGRLMRRPGLENRVSAAGVAGVRAARSRLPGPHLLLAFRDSLAMEDLAGYLHDYAVVTAYDRSLSRLRSACAGGVDLCDAAHRDALLHWLRSWGCRHLRLTDNQRTTSVLLSWWERYADGLPGIEDELSELDGDQIHTAGSAYAALATTRAAGRSGSRELAVSFGGTAAAKTLFAVRPLAFPPWDAPIRTAFGFTAVDGGAFASSLALAADALRGLAERLGMRVAELPFALKRSVSSPAKLVDEYLWVRVSRDLQ
jgi:hypothetical protein